MLGDTLTCDTLDEVGVPVVFGPNSGVVVEELYGLIVVGLWLESSANTSYVGGDR